MANRVGGSIAEDDLLAKGSKRDAIFAQAMEAPSREAFLGEIKASAPRDFTLFGRAVRETADVLFPHVPSNDYRPSYVVRPFTNVPDVCLKWKQKYIDNWDATKGRPRSLVLIGPSRWGKTEWARSLGEHLFFGGLFNMDKVADGVKYGVLDDIDINFFPTYKSWMGGQQEFEVTDKYKAKKTIQWGKPCIWTVNQNNDPREGKFADRAWLRANCFFVDLTRPMFDQAIESELEDWEKEAGLE